MDALIEIVMLLVFHWRLGLSVVGAVVTAVCLAAVVPWFTGAFGIALVCASVGFGVGWEAAAERSRAGRMSARE